MPGHYAEHGRDHDRVLKGQGPEAAPSTPLEACAAAMTGGTTVESRPASLPTRVPLWGFAERLDAVERTELVLDSLEGQRTHCLAGVDGHPANRIDRQVLARFPLSSRAVDIDRLVDVLKALQAVVTKLDASQLASGVTRFTRYEDLVACGQAGDSAAMLTVAPTNLLGVQPRVRRPVASQDLSGSVSVAVRPNRAVPE